MKIKNENARVHQQCDHNDPPSRPPTPPADKVQGPPPYLWHEYARRRPRPVLPGLLCSPKTSVVPGEAGGVFRPHSGEAGALTDGVSGCD